MELKMTVQTLINEVIEIENAPEIPGFLFRGFRGEEDYQHMVNIITATKKVDKNEMSISVEDLTRDFAHLERCDPYKDMLFAEVNGEVIGHSRGWWDEELNGDRLYNYFVFLIPEWRDAEIGEAMSMYMQKRLHEVASEHPSEAPKYYQVWASDTEHWNTNLFRANDFEAARYEITMTRPCSEPIDSLLLPEGIEVRPSKKENIRKVWDAANEAFRDHWGYVEPTEKDFKSWQEYPNFNPKLWKVAWEGEEVVGSVLNFINHDENQEYNRQRGYTEGISIRSLWRKRGVARALLTQSIKMFQEMGMKETCLVVDAENISGAMRLYEGVGYKEIKRHTVYRKRMD